MITGISESRTWTKHVSCKCEYKFDGRKCNLNQNCNNDKRRCECKNPKEHQCQKGYFCNPATCSCENGKYARSIGDSVVIYDESIEEIKTVPIKSTSTKTISTNFYILLAFLLITIALITISIYLIKHQSKQKHILPYQGTSKLKSKLTLTIYHQKWRVIAN